MNSLIGDRFLKHFLRRIRRESNPGAASDGQTLTDGGVETMAQSGNVESEELQQNEHAATLIRDDKLSQENSE